MVKHPGPDREFAEWAKKKKLRWLAVDCGSADHPMNTIIRDWMPRQAKEAERVFKKKFNKSLSEFYDDSKYQLMHIELFPHGIIHPECCAGDIDLLLNRSGQQCESVHGKLLQTFSPGLNGNILTILLQGVNQPLLPATLEL